MTSNFNHAVRYTHYGMESQNRVWILHGIFGSRQNWGGFARSMVKACPDLSVYTIDLLAHGDHPQHAHDYTIQACVQDLFDLSQVIGLPTTVIGHSFGGKVALAYAHTYSSALQHVWALDSSLDAKRQTSQNEILDMIRLCRQTPMPQTTRKDFMQALQSQGASLPVAQWMTTNLISTESGYQWRFKLDGIEELIHDYWNVDAWQLLDTFPKTTQAHLLRAEQGLRWTSEAVENIQKLTQTYSNLHEHILPQSGHWVHIDQPKVLLTMIIQHSLS